MLRLPLHLEGVAKVLKLDTQKMREGKDLIRYFKLPCKLSKANNVEVERAIRKKLEKYPITDKEQKLWILDQQINDRGILVDTGLVTTSIKLRKKAPKMMLIPMMRLGNTAGVIIGENERVAMR